MFSKLKVSHRKDGKKNETSFVRQNETFPEQTELFMKRKPKNLY